MVLGLFYFFLIIFVGIWAFLLIIRTVISLPSSKGKGGELFVFSKLQELNPAVYKVLEDLMLPSQGHTEHTQIDFIVVSSHGIFCIEVKALNGWIFGDANKDYWTQVIYKFKKRFYNPLHQNFAHIKAIEQVLGSQHLKAPVISLVALTNADMIKVSGTDFVGHTYEVINKIKSYTATIYSDSERDEIYNLLLAANITDTELRKAHVNEVWEHKKY